MFVNVRGLADAARDQELETLERLERKADKLIEFRYLRVSAGRVVMMQAKDENGDVIIDARTGLPAEFAMEDYAPVLNAILARAKLMERKAKLLGIDRPAATAAIEPENPIGDLSPAQFDLAMSRWFTQMNGRKAAAEAETVTPRPVETLRDTLASDPIVRGPNATA
jgi:hypothetical protein